MFFYNSRICWKTDVDPAFLDVKYNISSAKYCFSKVSERTHIESEELQQIPSLHKLNIFELEKVIEYPPLFMPQPDENSEKNWILNNNHRVFYPIQKDPLSRLILVANVLEKLGIEYEIE